MHTALDFFCFVHFALLFMHCPTRPNKFISHKAQRARLGNIVVTERKSPGISYERTGLCLIFVRRSRLGSLIRNLRLYIFLVPLEGMWLSPNGWVTSHITDVASGRATQDFRVMFATGRPELGVQFAFGRQHIPDLSTHAIISMRRLCIAEMERSWNS